MSEKFTHRDNMEGSRLFKGYLLSEVLKHMTRLDSASNTSILSPVQRLNIAIEANSLGIKPVARKHLLSQHVVTRAKRDASAIVVFLDGKQDEIRDPDILFQTNKLKQINEELLKLSKIVEDQPIRSMLNTVPHAKELFNEYFKTRSVKTILDEYYVPYSEDQARAVRHFFIVKSVDSALKHGLATLARRYVLSKWLAGGIQGIDGNVTKMALYVLENDFSSLPRNQRDQIGSVRVFLRKIMNKEFQVMGNGSHIDQKDPMLFPEQYKGSDEDIIEAYRNFSNQNYCPLTFKNYAQLVVDELSITDRMGQMFGPQYDGYNRLVDFDSSGMTFLENILINPNTKPNSQILTFSTMETLKRIKKKLLEIDQ